MLQKIEIDFEIHQLIEAKRKGFDEPPYFALRRLLGLGEPKKIEQISSTTSIINSRPFIEDGLEIPHGSLAKMEYMRGTQVHEGEFSNGMIIVNGKSFSSLSSAAISLARKRDGSKVTALNGWKYWQVKRPSDNDWILMWNLRAELER